LFQGRSFVTDADNRLIEFELALLFSPCDVPGGFDLNESRMLPNPDDPSCVLLQSTFLLYYLKYDDDGDDDDDDYDDVLCINKLSTQ